MLRKFADSVDSFCDICSEMILSTHKHVQNISCESGLLSLFWNYDKPWHLAFTATLVQWIFVVDWIKKILNTVCISTNRTMIVIFYYSSSSAWHVKYRRFWNAQFWPHLLSVQCHIMVYHKRIDWKLTKMRAIQRMIQLYLQRHRIQIFLPKSKSGKPYRVYECGLNDLIWDLDLS